jgi:hypothetical protein
MCDNKGADLLCEFRTLINQRSTKEARNEKEAKLREKREH